MGNCAKHGKAVDSIRKNLLLLCTMAKRAILPLPNRMCRPISFFVYKKNLPWVMCELVQCNRNYRVLKFISHVGGS